MILYNLFGTIKHFLNVESWICRPIFWKDCGIDICLVLSDFPPVRNGGMSRPSMRSCIQLHNYIVYLNTLNVILSELIKAQPSTYAGGFGLRRRNCRPFVKTFYLSCFLFSVSSYWLLLTGLFPVHVRWMRRIYHQCAYLCVVAQTHAIHWLIW